MPTFAYTHMLVHTCVYVMYLYIRIYIDLYVLTDLQVFVRAVHL